ncbi:hypothetical protein ACFV1W_30140 [Kitasatospora sp. NPDC059648]|uniref:hypothetical protein n=1 Tax=Kitasatospora sp. NPDC059648 TaxID=3346894 RepID=UPI0036750C1A
MDRFQLCRALRAAGVPQPYYEIPGCPRGPNRADRYFLEERAGMWVVGVRERGGREVLEHFTDEDRACRWLYDRLTDEGPSPVPATSEEMDALLHDGDAIQRRAREQFERALAKARRQNLREPAADDGPAEPPPVG